MPCYLVLCLFFPETGNPVNKPPNQNGDDWDSVDAAKQPDDGDDGDDGEPQKKSFRLLSVPRDKGYVSEHP